MTPMPLLSPCPSCLPVPVGFGESDASGASARLHPLNTTSDVIMSATSTRCILTGRE